MRTKIMTLSQSCLVIAAVASLIGCNQVSTSSDVAIASIRALSSAPISSGCFEDVYNYKSDVVNSDEAVDFTLKSNWQGQVDLNTVESVRDPQSDGSVDITIQYCETGHSLVAGQSCTAGASDGSQNVVVCHVPPGNPANAHEILVSWDGWIHGHSHHQGDHLGPCNAPPSDPGTGGTTGTPTGTTTGTTGTGTGTTDTTSTGTTTGTTSTGTTDTTSTGTTTGTTSTGTTDTTTTTTTTTGGAWTPTCTDVTLCGTIN